MAWLFEHELLHNFGYRHHQMRRQNRMTMAEYAWADALFPDGLPVKTPKAAKPRPDIRAVRYARVLAGIKRWTAKRKRAETALRRLRQQQRYYERSMAAKEGAAAPRLQGG